MKTKFFLILILSLVLSCSSSSKLLRPQIQPEIPIAELCSKGILPFNTNYKKSYYKILPYLFFNEGGTFIKIHGDFYNLKFNSNSDINIMPGFWSDYGSHQNSLIVLVSLSETSKLPLKDIPISVESSKHGTFEKEKLIGNQGINRVQQRILFVKKLELENEYDVLNKINDDVITVTIGGQIYKFLNPELSLDY